ncbi:MAG: glycosyltransferase, partial [Phycisphaerales bacterium]|nr:glycosyltransferase [Phycisphaerales bacterium]
ADRAITSISTQTYPTSSVDLVIIDNGSTDGSVEYLAERWGAHGIVDNPTAKAHEPAFGAPSTEFRNAGSNPGGFRSVTIVRNAHNHGGCGGFNTGLAFVDQRLATRDDARPDFVWLADDDAEFPSDALAHLVGAATSDPKIGIVGSRMVDMNDHDHTLETTVFYDHTTGLLGPTPPPGHRCHDEHRRWRESLGGDEIGHHTYTGIRDVDVVAACSLLARWDAVEKIGFWDHRYFIYSDDADWGLRFVRAGWRVVCNLDARVFHLPWHQKLTPARLYYGQRNVIWMGQKVLPDDQLKRVTFKRLGAVMRDALRAWFHRRGFHADILRRTASDVVQNRGGRLDYQEPPKEPVAEGLARVGALRSGASIAFVCNNPDQWGRARETRERIREALRTGAVKGSEPSWTFCLRNDVPGSHDDPEEPGDRHIVYSWRKRSKLRRQLGLLLTPPKVLVAFDQCGDFPLLTGSLDGHIDSRAPELIQIDRNGIGRRLAFLVVWCWTGVRIVWHVATLKRHESEGRYG